VHIEKQFDVKRPRAEAAKVLADDDTLVSLFPDTDTEIVERKGSRRTTRSRYRALGREGVATFHFDVSGDGNVRFEKVCDGRVWKELRGQGTRVRIEMEGRTKALVPEFTIRGPMQEQIEQMANALREKLRGAKKPG
jgi:carbon monoxide dehydrogenase subunit G